MKSRYLETVTGKEWDSGRINPTFLMLVMAVIITEMKYRRQIGAVLTPPTVLGSFIQSFYVYLMHSFTT